MQCNINKNETGKSTVIAMLTTLCLISAYGLFGREFLVNNYPVIIDQLALALLSIIAVFSIGCGLHMAFVGDRSSKDARKDLRNRLIEFGDFVDFGSEKIKEFESASRFHIHAIRPIGLDSLSVSRRIVQALALRVNQVNSLLNSGNTMDLIEAEELLNKDLELSENCVETLIGSNPIPPLAIRECIPKVSELLDTVAIEIDRIRVAA